MVARRGPAGKKKKIKRIFFDFKHKKEARRKGINVSQLVIKSLFQWYQKKT